MNLRLRIMPGSRAARNNPKVRVADDPARIVEQPKVDDRQSLDGHTTTHKMAAKALKTALDEYCRHETTASVSKFPRQ